MKTSKVLLMLAAILSFDLSIFQALLSLRPKWSAAFGAPSALLVDRDLLLTAGLSTALAVAICGIYALSGAGIIVRLPLLRLGLLGIGCGYVLVGAAVIPQLLEGSHLLPAPSPMPLRLVSASFVTVMTGLCYLAGLAFGWEHLADAKQDTPAAAGARPAMRISRG